jgi:segregation and condensation protein B
MLGNLKLQIPDSKLQIKIKIQRGKIYIMEIKNTAQIIEAILFTADHPVSIKEIKSVIEGIETQDIKEALNFLKEQLSSRDAAITVLEIAGGYQLGTVSTLAPWLKKFHHITKKGKLSKPALETLSIIAYRQPITRAEAEAVRGVNVDGVIKTLLERKLIKISGKKPVPGRPLLYSTTQNFLQHFGINSVKELPALEELGNKENLAEITASEVEPTNEAKTATKACSEQSRGGSPEPLDTARDKQESEANASKERQTTEEIEEAIKPEENYEQIIEPPGDGKIAAEESPEPLDTARDGESIEPPVEGKIEEITEEKTSSN